VPLGALLMTAVGYGFFEVVCGGPEAPPLLIQTCAAHVAVGDLVASQVDGMVAAEVGCRCACRISVAGIAHVEA